MFSKKNCFERFIDKLVRLKSVYVVSCIIQRSFAISGDENIFHDCIDSILFINSHVLS